MPNQPELPFAAAPTESPGAMPTASSVNAMPGNSSSPLRAAEFFAGIGLVRMALQRAGIDVVWANDIEPIKERIYSENFGTADFRLGDVRQLRGSDLPDVDVATASFPCTDLSLAGWRRGLAGSGSGMFWEFARVLWEMGDRRPQAILLENVPGFVTSHGGAMYLFGKSLRTFEDDAMTNAFDDIQTGIRHQTVQYPASTNIAYLIMLPPY